MIRPELADRIELLRVEREGSRDASAVRLLSSAARLLEARWATRVARGWLSAQITKRTDEAIHRILTEVLAVLESIANAPHASGSCEFCPANADGCSVCGYEERDDWFGRVGKRNKGGKA